MLPFDFNIHLPCAFQESADATIGDETTMDLQGYLACHQKHHDAINANSNGANFMLFNPALALDPALPELCRELKSAHPGSLITQLLDFRAPGLPARLEALKAAGVDGIKFHSYVQRIVKADFPLAIDAALQAQALGFFICVDTSYGTPMMYRCDNMALAAAIAAEVTAAPIVLLHGGTSRILEALFLVDSTPNVWLESSFSLRFLEGSSAEGDFAYAFKKLDGNRILYGSDFPYVGFADALSHIERFFSRYGFSDTQTGRILFQNAKALTGG